MADGRLTQAGVLAASEGVGEARVTQAGALVLTPFTSEEARATQAGVLAVVDFELEARLTQLAVLALADGKDCLTQWAQCWRLERTDGEVIARSDHDEAVLFRGESYTPCYGFSASAHELASLLGAVGNQELLGIFSGDGVTESDLFGGVYDGAFLEVWMVPWSNPNNDIPWRLTAGTLGKVSEGKLGFTAEVLSAAARLQQQPLLQLYTPGCRWEGIEDPRCGVDFEALTVAGAATSVAVLFAKTAASRRSFTDSARAEAEGYFEHGTLTWTTGANAGIGSEVKSFAAGSFTLWQAMLHPIQPGDQYEAVPGCDLTKETCIAKFDNYVNFGGFPDVPGQDEITKTPDAKG
jgi:uncharacterized phage protein (TIGR02218 family)